MKKLITDKTLAAFEKWYYETHCKSSIKFEDLLLWQKSEVFDLLYSQCETIQHAFAVEFFDSINLDFSEKTTLWEYCFEERHSDSIDSFKVICFESLKMANAMFNSREWEQANVYFDMADRFASQFKDILKNSK